MDEKNQPKFSNLFPHSFSIDCVVVCVFLCALVITKFIFQKQNFLELCRLKIIKFILSHSLSHSQTKLITLTFICERSRRGTWDLLDHYHHFFLPLPSFIASMILTIILELIRSTFSKFNIACKLIEKLQFYAP